MSCPILTLWCSIQTDSPLEFNGDVADGPLREGSREGATPEEVENLFFQIQVKIPATRTGVTHVGRDYENPTRQCDWLENMDRKILQRRLRIGLGKFSADDHSFIPDDAARVAGGRSICRWTKLDNGGACCCGRWRLWPWGDAIVFSQSRRDTDTSCPCRLKRQTDTMYRCPYYLRRDRSATRRAARGQCISKTRPPAPVAQRLPVGYESLPLLPGQSPAPEAAHRRRRQSAGCSHLLSQVA